MTIPEILKALESDAGEFPREALEAAIQQREAITPELLSIVEKVSEKPESTPKNSLAHVFALFLLAQFREKRAFVPLVRMVSHPGETAFELLDDAVCDDLGRLLGSLYDGNTVLLEALVESDAVNEYVRSAALDAFVVLENTGQMSRETVLEYFRSLFERRLLGDNSLLWGCLASLVADLPAPELLSEVRQAYAEDMVDEMMVTLKEVERDAAAPNRRQMKRYVLITDAIAEMESWACFRDDFEDDLLLSEPPPEWDALPPEPCVREPKIGRNDPCPCGSGKKFKKCCGK